MSVLVFIIKILFKGKLFQLRNHDKTCNTIPSNTIQRTKNMAICIVCLILAILFSSLVSALNVFSCNFRRIISTLANIKGKAIRPNRIQRPKVVRTLFIFNLSQKIISYSSSASALNVFCVVIGNLLQLQKSSQEMFFDFNKQHSTTKICKKTFSFSI